MTTFETAKVGDKVWDEIKYEVPTKPLPDIEIDTPVIVWDFPQDKHRRYFSNFTNGKIRCFLGGKTSWSSVDGSTQRWENWELPK